MIRTTVSRCLLALSATVALSTTATLSALETPMILPAGGGGTAGIIDPGLGTITTVEFTEKQSLRKGYANWLFDLDQLERRIQLEQNGETWSALRWGSTTMKPSLEEVTRLFPATPTKKQTEAGQKSTQAQVREAEQAYWEKPEKYDGVVRGAYNGQELMLVLPSKRAVLFYRNTGKDTVELAAWGTYSPLLYIQTAWKSLPDPNQLVKGLNLTDDEKKALDGALAAREDGGAPAAAKSDVWCTTVNGGFVVVDSANQKIWSYEVKGQGFEVTSVRSMAVDLMAPGYQTLPLDQTSADTLAKSYGKDLAGLGIDKLDAPYIEALVAANRVGDTAKAGSIHANAVKDSIVINFTAQNKLVSYTYRSGAGLMLSSVRDTGVDQGLLMIVRMMNEKGMARQSFTEAGKNASKHDTAACLRNLTYALGLDPTLHNEAEKSSSLKNELKTDWDRLMADAAKAEEALLKKRESIKAAADAERERLKNRKK